MATMGAIGEAAMDAPPPPLAATPYLFHRHALLVRITHWVNALAITFLLMTGLNIFNAHPILYWGTSGSNPDIARSWLEIGSDTGERGFVRIGSTRFDTTGVLGVSTGSSGTPSAIGYPGWATFPSYRDLATARNWHFFFAWVLILNGLVYLGHGLVTGHIRRDLLPRLAEMRPANVIHDIIQHAKLQFPKGEESKRYHILQKLAYAGTALVLVPTVIFTGLGMSPAANAAWPWILDLVGGRATARSLHFIAMNLILVFILVHLAMVLLAGPYNEIRSMITGKFRVDPEDRKLATPVNAPDKEAQA